MRKFIVFILTIGLVLGCVFLPYTAQAQTLREAYAELEKRKKDAQNNQYQQGVTQDELTDTQKQIQKMAANIEQTKEDIEQTKEDIENLNKEMEKKDGELRELAVFQQISDGETAYLEYALDTESMTEFIYRMAVIKQLMEYNAKLMKEMEQNIKDKQQKTKDLEKQEKSFEKQKKELEAKTASLELKQEQLEIGYSTILEDIKAQQALLEDAEARGCKLDDDINNCGESLPNNTRFLRPTTGYRITSVYDPSGTHPSRQDLPVAWRPHTGTDIGATSGTNVYAIGYGVVTRVSYESCGGNYIWIVYKMNGSYYSSGYYHLSKQLVKVGDTVTPNTVVGKVGSTGSCTTGPHLHFEMTKGARYVTAGLYGVPKSQCFSSGVSKWRIDPTTIVNLPGYWQRFDGR